MTKTVTTNGNDIITTFAGQDLQGDVGEEGLAASLASIASQKDTIAGDFTDNRFGAKGDWNGTTGTDDTASLQSAINSLTHGGRLISPPNKVYQITSPLIIQTSNITIDWNGSKLVYTGTQSLGSNNGINRYYGAITLQGSVDSSKQLSITSVTPNYYNSTIYRTVPMAKISTTASDATTTFAVGDIILVAAQNFGSSWAQDYSDNPAKATAPAKIISISGGDIFVDINPDFVFGGVNFSGTITKVNTLDNITIKNLFYEDANNAVVPSSPTNTDRESWVGGIHAYYCRNLNIDNFEATKHRFPALMMNYIYNYSIENGRFYYARAVSSGCGYGIQNNFCSHGNIQKLRAISIRHLCDFSGGGHHYVEDAEQPDFINPNFDCHGLGEFDITFNRVSGSLGIGNGISSFPNMTTGIKLNDFHGSLLIDWVKDIKITNSRVNFMEEHTTNRVVNFNISNSKIYGSKTSVNMVASSRGSNYLDSMFIVDKCELEIQNILHFDSSSPLALIGYENVNFTNNPKLQNKYPATVSLWLLACKYIRIINNTIKDLGFMVQNDYSGTITEPVNNITIDYGSVFWDKNICLTTWNNTGNPSFLDMNGGTVSMYKITANNNFYDAIATSRWVRFGSGFTGTFYLTCSGNTFSRNISDAVFTSPTTVKQSNNNLISYSGSLLVDSPKLGTLTYNGDGTTTTKVIAHGLGKNPNFFQVTPSSVDAGVAGIKYVSADATNLTVTFNTAPISGTNNVKLTWKAEY